MDWNIESQELKNYLEFLLEEYDQVEYREAYIHLFNDVFAYAKLDSNSFNSTERNCYNPTITNKEKKKKVESLKKNILKIKEEYITLQKQLGFSQYIDVNEATDNMFNKEEILFATHCDRAIQTLENAYKDVEYQNKTEKIKINKIFQTESQFIRERKRSLLSILHFRLFNTYLGGRIISKSMCDETNGKEYPFYKLYRLVCQEFGYPVNQVCTVFRDYKPTIAKRVK